MSEGERRLAAIMFTDVVGFTTMGQSDETLALQLLDEHRAVVRPIISKHHGVEVKTIGDAFLFEFASVLDAVVCAVEIQEAMRDRNSGTGENRRVQMRIGVHVGDVVHRQGDILGDAVNVASRFQPLAPPGGVCISEQVFDQVRNKFDLPLEKVEGKKLKNVSVPVDVYRIVMPWEIKTEQAQELDAKRVAVLPLKNMSPDPNDEYFADGMTEELITALSSVTELTVIARTSVMQYKNAPKRIADIGRELGVGTLIEGSVRKAANKVRITVQMINAENEGHLWAQNYDKMLDDVFTVQSEVAEKVAEALKVKLVESERKRLQKGGSRDPEAYNIYLQGLFYWNKRTPEALRKAATIFEESTRKDPTFALGYAGMASAYFITAANFYDDPGVYYPKAKEYAIKALSLDDDIAEAHAVLASILVGHEREWDKGEAEFKKAIEINPSYPSAHQWYAQYLGALNRNDEGWAEINKALELSPLSLIINCNLADALRARKEYDKALEVAKKVIDMEPNFPVAYQSLIFTGVESSNLEEAENGVRGLAKVADPLDVKGMTAYVRAHQGRSDEARALLEELSDPKFRGRVTAYGLASTYFFLGDTDKGFELLERAYQSRDRYMMFMGTDEDVKSVRSDPRYVEMLGRMGLAGRLRA